MILQKLEKAEGFSDIEREVASYILTHKQLLSNLSIRELAKLNYTSTSTILRLCRKVNTSGYTEFRMRFCNEIKEELLYGCSVNEDTPFHNLDSYEEISEHIANISMRGIQETLQMLDYELLHKVVVLLQNARSIDIYGDGSSLSSAYEFKNKMLRLGRLVQIEESHTAQNYLALNSDEHHCAIIISHSGEHKDSLETARLLHHLQIRSICITSEGDNTLSKYCDYQICTGSYENKTLIGKLETFTSHTTTHFILDCLYCYMYTDNYDTNVKRSEENEKLLRKRQLLK